MDPDIHPIALCVTGAAFGLAVVFGVVAQRFHFCTLGAIADDARFGDSHRLRTGVLATAVAIARMGVLTLAGVLDPAKMINGNPRVSWLSHFVGGLLFVVAALRLGGDTAMGRSIGEGISGVSTLAIGSILAPAAIIAGTLAELMYQMRRVERSDGWQMPSQRGGASGVSEPS